MSIDLANQPLNFLQALQTSDPEKIFSALISVIQLDEYIEEHTKTQRVEQLRKAYEMAKNIA
ncbi:hypothetical protein [Ammoniphilus sp. CFH 90114]|uniref:hypothetical protein n=1 Tax=Ammoniphilus sp. CFH 90114 TaxID=2493665 RepID=UPI00100F3FC5|nr:hypothetical protein [Ammoniphilus sp. CFH 90114]RXT04566.1 hypothetical protein EIZ39_20340 [Ammoniphilus sp. CFH 90114]